MTTTVYHDPGPAALLSAALYLRELARLEFAFGNDQEGLFLSQSASDLIRVAYRLSPRNTATWRAFAHQFPNLFQARASVPLRAV